MIGKTVGGYRILKKIDEGGMGAVYLADYPDKGFFAVKGMAYELSSDPEFRWRFFNEVRTHFSLIHPNIVRPYTYFEEHGNLFLVMEYVDGGDLASYIHQRGPLPLNEALYIFKDALEGLNYANMKGIIHRDIKPSNILLSRNKIAKIMDFGIAIMPNGKRLTKTGLTMGTPQYMSPEHINPKKLGPTDHRSDVYSMGIVLYEMLTGYVPFDGETTYEIYEKHIKSPLPALSSVYSHIPYDFEQLIRKALEKDAANRFAGCGDFLNHIRLYESRAKIQVSPPPQNDNTYVIRQHIKIPNFSIENYVLCFAMAITLIILSILFMSP